MAAKLSPQVQQLVAKAAELPLDELAVLAEAIHGLRGRNEAPAPRHEIIAERVARVQMGNATTLSVDDVEQSIREELGF